MNRQGARLAAVLAILLVTDLLLFNQSAWTVAIAVGASTAIFVIARSARLRAKDLGLAREDLAAGMRWGLGVSVVLLVACVVAALLPFMASAFDDDRTPEGATAVLIKVLVIIPLRTVLLEELAFRGVLFGWMARTRGEGAAIVWSSAAFGLWHVPPALMVIRTNDALSWAQGSVALSGVVVLGVVLATGAAGAFLAWLRDRTGSLAAPALVHWTANSATTVIGHLLR